jgi:hypothetical protein
MTIITRRRILVVTASAVAVSSSAVVMAQSTPVPTREEVQRILKDAAIDPTKGYSLLLEGIDSLVHVLALRAIQKTEKPGNLEAWFAVRRSFPASTLKGDVIEYSGSSEAGELIAKAGEAARPTAVKIEAMLDSGGVSPKGEVGRQMVRSFFLFVQIKAVAERQLQPTSWWCDVYPISWICSLT